MNLNIIQSRYETWEQKCATHIVISCWPSRIELGVKLPLFPGQLIVFGLLLSWQGMPLWTEYIKGHLNTLTHTHIYVCVNSNAFVCTAYPSSKDLVDGRALFQSALCHHFGSHLLHIQHKSIQRLLDMRLLVLFFLGRNGGLSANPKQEWK